MGATKEHRSAEERASELLGRMTLEEKAAQLVGLLPHTLGAPDLDPGQLEAQLASGIGHICGVGTVGTDPVGVARMTNGIQRFLREHTRLGIPAIVHNEALNGVTSEGFTSFPTAIALAATWDPARVEQMADLIRRQLVSIGVRQALAPVLDVARDARWGRIHETYGEDVLLASAFGVSYVRGMQGADLTSGVVATAKHFLGYAMTEGGQNMAATQLGARELRDVHAAPFEAAIRLAKLGSVMNSYSEIDGQPVAIAREILTDLLRETLGFDGTVVSDYRSLYYVVNRQGIGTAGSVGAAALHAGLDVELPAPFGFGAETVAGVESGVIPLADLDRAVHRTLTHKFALGLFDDPYVDTTPEVISALATSGRDLSRTLVEESITLLKNEGGLLPLDDGLRSLAVIGPHADSVMAGFANYTHPPFLETLRAIALGRSNLAGMEQLAGASSDKAKEAASAKFAALAQLDPEAVARSDYGAKSLYEALRDALPQTIVTTARGSGLLEAEEGGLSAAVESASDADVVVLAIGGRSAAFAGRATEGEGSDSATIEIPAAQRRLIDEVAALGKPVIAVVYAGKPYALAEIESQVDAIITAYIPGPEGGAALADALVGIVNPAGKLPFTIPRHVGQVPIFHSQKRGSGHRRVDADQFRSYVDLPNTPLYPFGHGLSYTTFELSDLRVPDRVVVEGALNVQAAVANTGEVAGTQVVQLYVSTPSVTISRPERQLAAFARVDLEPGESATIEFSVDLRQLGYTCEDGRFVVDPGSYGIAVGFSSEDLPLRDRIAVDGQRSVVEEPHAQLPRVQIRSHRADAA